MACLLLGSVEKGKNFADIRKTLHNPLFNFAIAVFVRDKF